VGGTVGGLLGGILSVVLRGVWTGIFSNKPSELLWSPSAMGFVALGMCIGLLIGLAQVILKEAWVRIEAGFARLAPHGPDADFLDGIVKRHMASAAAFSSAARFAADACSTLA
jgi:hypothetical protein